MKQGNRSRCPINLSLEIWGDKWTLLIIRDMMFVGKRTYGDFLKSEEGISTNILADRLKMLTEKGIIEQSNSTQTRSGSAYRLTPKGIGLLPIMAEIYIWSDAHLDLTDELRNRIQDIKDDKASFIAAVTETLTRDNS